MSGVNEATSTNVIHHVVMESATATQSAERTPLLAEPSACADVGFAIATMVIENAFTSRMQARKDRQRANEAMIAAQKQQIAAMREAAEERYAAAKAEAVGKFVDGGLGIAGGSVTFAEVKGLGDAIGSGGKIGSGVANICGASNKYDGDQLDADAKAAENEAAQQKRLIEAADDDVKEAREYTRAALDFLREMESTKTKSLSSAIRA